MHGDGSLGDRAEGRATIQPVGLTREEGRVAFEFLDGGRTPAGCIDHLLEQKRRRGLRVPEDRKRWYCSEIRIAADVGDQEQSASRPHGETLTGREDPVSGVP